MKIVFYFSTMSFVMAVAMTDDERKQCQRNLYENSDLEELSAEKFRSIESAPIIDDDYKLECPLDVCCTSSEVGQMTWQLSGIILDKFNQQAESVRFATGKIRQIYGQLISQARNDFDVLFQLAYKSLYTKNRDIVDSFLDDLDELFTNNKSPGDIFDDFFKRLTRRNYLVLKHREFDDLSSEEKHCLQSESSKIYSKTRGRKDRHIHDRAFLRSNLERSLKPLKNLLWTLEEVSTFLSTLSEEKLLPSARCVSPTRYCGPCTNQINLFYYEDCEVFHENMCFEWLRGWSHLVRFMEADIKAIKNIQSEYYIYRVFETLPEAMSLNMRDFIMLENTVTNFMQQIDQNCQISSGMYSADDHLFSTDEMRRIHKKSARSTNSKLSDSYQITQFGQDLLQASTKATHLQPAIIRSVCDGLPKMPTFNHTVSDSRQSGKGLPTQLITAADLRLNNELDNSLRRIVQQVRQKRQITDSLSDDEDMFEEGSGHYGASGENSYDDVENSGDGSSGDYIPVYPSVKPAYPTIHITKPTVKSVKTTPSEEPKKTLPVLDPTRPIPKPVPTEKPVEEIQATPSKRLETPPSVRTPTSAATSITYNTFFTILCFVYVYVLL